MRFQLGTTESSFVHMAYSFVISQVLLLLWAIFTRSSLGNIYKVASQ